MSESSSDFENMGRFDFRGQKAANRSYRMDDVNKSSIGKLNQEQLEERLNLHAKRVFNNGKNPTIKQIAEYWGKEYDISMAYDSEKAWAKTHKDRIKKRIQEKIACGEFKYDDISPTSLLHGTFERMYDDSQVVKAISRKVLDIVENVDWMKSDNDVSQSVKQLKELHKQFSETYNKNAELMNKALEKHGNGADPKKVFEETQKLKRLGNKIKKDIEQLPVAIDVEISDADREAAFEE